MKHCIFMYYFLYFCLLRGVGDSLPFYAHVCKLMFVNIKLQTSEKNTHSKASMRSSCIHLLCQPNHTSFTHPLQGFRIDLTCKQLTVDFVNQSVLQMSSHDVEGKRSDKTDFAEKLGAMNRRWQILQGLIGEKVTLLPARCVSSRLVSCC